MKEKTRGKEGPKDERFEKILRDPRFRSLPKLRKRKNTIADERFAAADEDPAFKDGTFQLDKYGRTNAFAERKPDQENKGALQMQRMLGLYPSASDSESSENLESDDNVHKLEEWGSGVWAANPDEAISQTEATHRLAVVDMDWSKITAVDLLAAFRSFVQNPESVKRVVVYLSDYGIERLPKEGEQGPSALGLFKNEETEEDIDSETLRQYEKSKLRYYYAVVDCTTTHVAQHLMQELDGTEFETSRCTMDLRYVPDEETFDDRPIRDSAEKVPSNFEGHLFECNALQKTNVKISWDEDDDRRVKVVRRRFTEEDLLEQDYQAYVASQSEGSTEDEECKTAKREAYAALLKEDASPVHSKKEKRSKTVYSETSGTDSEEGEGLGALLLNSVQKKIRKDGKKIWDRFEKRRSEKLKRQRRRGQFKVDSSASDTDSGLSSVPEGKTLFEEVENEKEVWIDRPETRQELKNETSLPESSKPSKDIELIAMDEDLLREVRLGRDVEVSLKETSPTKRKLSRKERRKQSLANKKHRKASFEVPSDFKVNVYDPRFEALFHPDFAIDPTDPAFKSTQGADAVLRELRHKKDVSPKKDTREVV